MIPLGAHLWADEKSMYVNREGEWRAIFKSAASQLPSTQNNPSTEVVYFRVMYSDSLQP